MGTNCRQLGYQRDNKILELLDEYKVLTADQVQQLLFSEQNQGLRIAQRRLKTLYERGEVFKKRDDITLKYFYYNDPDLKQLAHIAEVNDMYFALKNNLESWERIYCYNREADYGILRCDGFVGVQNTVTNKIRFYFLEADRSGNKFDKVKLYNQLFEQEHNWWWVKHTEKFPSVLVKTFRPGMVERCIEKENKNNIDFRIL